MENMTPPFPFKSNEPLEDKENDLKCISQTSFSLNLYGHYILPWHCTHERLMVVYRVLWPGSSMQDPFSAPHLRAKGECVLSALQSHTPLGRLKHWVMWGRLVQAAQAGQAHTHSKKEWKSFKVGHRHRKLRAHLEPAARRQRSRWHTAHHTPVYLLCSSSLCSWYNNSLQPPWVSQAGLVFLLPVGYIWATQRRLLGSTGVPQSFSCCRFSWQGKTQLDLHISSWMCEADWGEVNNLQVLSNWLHMIWKSWMDNKQAISLPSLPLLLNILCTV